MLSQEEITNKQIKEEENKCMKQLFLKTIVMMLFFYIMLSPVIQKLCKKSNLLNKKLGINLSTSLLFGLFYFTLHVLFI